ncbi:MAG TPA: PIN domain-containing protein [Gemmataceae bacterium]|nr:PIN domain-containing protein [Gemmataceae bacterium]
MTVFLDASVVIYLIEQPAVFGPNALARVTALQAGGDQLVVSDLVRMECQVGPLKSGNHALLSQFTVFFTTGAGVQSITPALCDRAAAIRAAHGFKALDALHLAAAVEHGCGLFLTADAQLARFPDIAVEVLS